MDSRVYVFGDCEVPGIRMVSFYSPTQNTMARSGYFCSGTLISHLNLLQLRQVIPVTRMGILSIAWLARPRSFDVLVSMTKLFDPDTRWNSRKSGRACVHVEQVWSVRSDGAPDCRN